MWEKVQGPQLEAIMVNYIIQVVTSLSTGITRSIWKLGSTRPVIGSAKKKTHNMGMDPNYRNSCTQEGGASFAANNSCAWQTETQSLLGLIMFAWSSQPNAYPRDLSVLNIMDVLQWRIPWKWMIWGYSRFIETSNDLIYWFICWSTQKVHVWPAPAGHAGTGPGKTVTRTPELAIKNPTLIFIIDSEMRSE